MSSQRPLSRSEASAYLLEKHGIKRAVGTLAKQASQGGGPPYRLARKQALYDAPALDKYAADITSEPAARSGEHVTRVDDSKASA